MLAQETRNREGRHTAFGRKLDALVERAADARTAAADARSEGSLGTAVIWESEVERLGKDAERLAVDYFGLRNAPPWKQRGVRRWARAQVGADRLKK